MANALVEQLALGKTNREIAAALLLSEKTVGSHLARIFDEHGVGYREHTPAPPAR